MSRISIRAIIPSYPDIDLKIETPITQPIKLRKQGITFAIGPTAVPGEYHIVMSKAKLMLAAFAVKENHETAN